MERKIKFIASLMFGASLLGVGATTVFALVQPDPAISKEIIKTNCMTNGVKTGIANDCGPGHNFCIDTTCAGPAN